MPLFTAILFDACVFYLQWFTINFYHTCTYKDREVGTNLCLFGWIVFWMIGIKWICFTRIITGPFTKMIPKIKTSAKKN